MATWHSEILITTDPLRLRPNNWNGAAGASVDFWGIVRSLEERREISGIEYEAHQVIAEAARSQFDLVEVVLQHRIGFVAAGEASLFLRVASAHRGAAFQASAWIVAELKKNVPIWKRPIFVRQKRTALDP